MSADTTQNLVFRMIHYDNIAYVLSNGMCSRLHPLADPDYINIGDKGLIDQRNDYAIGINPPGGNLGEYVPFYFGGHSPMLLNIKTGYRGITRRPQQDIIFVCCKINKIIQLCNEWCFTDGHAKDAFTEFYNDVKYLDYIDWKMVYEQWWRPVEDDMDRQRRKQAEFLVKDMVPVSCIHCLIVRDRKRKDDVEQIVNLFNLDIPVKIDADNKLFYP